MCLGAVNQLLAAIMDELHRPSSRNNSISSPHGTLTDQQLQSNYKSAFEITSVSDAPPDGEEEPREELVVPGRDGEEAKAVIDTVKKEDVLTELPSGSSSLPELQAGFSIPHLNSYSQTDFSEPARGARPLNAPGAVGNGPSQVGLSRFRRVNHYHRGKWQVRDTLEPEERPESELKAVQQAAVTTVAVRNTDPLLSTSSSSSSPAASRKVVQSDWEAQSRSGSDLGHVGEPIVKEPPVDQSSTTHDSRTISRNTSFSSLSGHTTEKTEDQGERLKEFEQDSVPVPKETVTQDTTFSPEDAVSRHCVCSTCSQRYVCLSACYFILCTYVCFVLV